MDSLDSMFEITKQIHENCEYMRKNTMTPELTKKTVDLIFSEELKDDPESTHSCEDTLYHMFINQINQQKLNNYNDILNISTQLGRLVNSDLGRWYA